MTFITPADLVFTWNVDGVAGGERMVYLYGQTRPTGQRTGAWFNPAESGWGVLIDDHFLPTNAAEHVIVVYFYDAQGRPTWALGGSPDLNSGSMVQRSFWVHCPTCPALVNFPAQAIGSLNYNYGSRTQGTYSINITLPAPLSGTWVRNNLPIQMLTQPLPNP